MLLFVSVYIDNNDKEIFEKNISLSTTDHTSDNLENNIENQELEAAIDALDANDPDPSSKMDPTEQVISDHGDLKVTWRC